MNHIAIDLGSRESQICVRNSEGLILEEQRRPTTALGKYLKTKEKGRVVLETCAEAFAIADAARAAGHDVTVVPSKLVRMLGVGDRGIKNDVRDAQNLSKVSCRLEELPSVHVPGEQSRERKAMSALRESLVEVRTKLVNTTRSWLRTQGVGVLRGGTLPTFPGRYRRHVEKRTGKPVPSYVDRVLKAIEELNPKIAEADKDLESIATQDPACKLLMTAPGVGPVTAVRFTAAIDDVSRFEDGHGVESYLGLIPGENSSGDAKKRHMKGITKAGPSRVRWALTQAAWTAMRCRKHDPMVEWARQIEERRGKKVAVIALVRKLAGVLYAMWRDGKPYDPRHESKVKAAATQRGDTATGSGVTATPTAP